MATPPEVMVEAALPALQSTRRPDGPHPLAIDCGLAHSVAHDIRSPLTAIQLCAETLSATDDPSLRHKYAVVIAEQARAIAWCLESLVALADAQEGHQRRLAPVNLTVVVDEALTEMDAVLATRGIRVVREYSGVARYALGVSCWLRQAVRGCLQAVFSVTPPGSCIWVTVDRPADAEAMPSFAAVTMVAGVGGAAAAGQLVEIPWRRLSMMAATRLARLQGGRVREVRVSRGTGLELIMPVVDPALTGSAAEPPDSAGYDTEDVAV